ncbi:MAG: M15 family metallopeptidase [Lachnospiraceae bacterium]|nr:M15 family metallopeptidase [Lachnospiraceae bacterium]
MRKRFFLLWFGIFIGAVLLIATVMTKIYSTHLANVPEISFSSAEKVDIEEQIAEEEWCLILVNKEHCIPNDYEVELVELSNGQCVDRRIYPALQEMFDTARSEGIYPVVASGYRTVEKQQSLMDEKIAAYLVEGYSLREAKEKAEIWVAAVGTSEHQLGISVDINADGVHSAGSEVYKWLDENSYQFGFIKRYPEDKTEITGIINEPWHYRYVGKAAAAEIYRSGVCLEEYLEELGQSNSIESDM